MPWLATLRIPSPPRGPPGDVDLCPSYLGPGAAHSSGAETSPHCLWPSEGLLDTPASHFLHKLLLLLCFNIKIPSRWCMPPGVLSTNLGGTWYNHNLDPDPS